MNQPSTRALVAIIAVNLGSIAMAVHGMVNRRSATDSALAVVVVAMCIVALFLYTFAYVRARRVSA